MQALAKDDASASPVEVRNLHKRHGKRFLIGRRKICPIEQDRSSILSLLEQNMRGELSTFRCRKAPIINYCPIRIKYVLVNIEPAKRSSRIVVSIFSQFFQFSQSGRKVDAKCLTSAGNIETDERLHRLYAML